MREHTDSIDTVYSRGLLERVAARNAKKKSASTKGLSLRKRVTTWLSNRRHIRLRDSTVQPSSSNTTSKAVYKAKSTPTLVKDTKGRTEEPTSRLIRRGLKHYDSSGLPGTIDVYSKSEQALQRERKTLSAGELYRTRRYRTRTRTNSWSSGSPTITTSKELDTPVITSESFDILPPMFDPRYHEYMDRRIRLLQRIKQAEEEERKKSICECLIS